MSRDLELPLPIRPRVFVRLDELPDPDGHPDGRRVRLREPNAIALRMAAEYDALPRDQQAAQAHRLWDMAAELLPDLDRVELDRLSAGTIHRILALGQQPIAELEAIAKNGGAPLAEAPKGTTASSSPTPPPGPSPASPATTGSTSGT